jgi:hypothetical protein
MIITIPENFSQLVVVAAVAYLIGIGTVVLFAYFSSDDEPELIAQPVNRYDDAAAGTNVEMTKLVDEHISKLSEHFDSISIMVTCPTFDGNGSSKQLVRGCGNFNARLGTARDWLIEQDEYTRIYARNQATKDL